MRESSLVPTNLLNWPRVARRLPEEKLLILALWSAPWMSCAGYGELPLCPFAASIGISPESTETGISNLEQAGLVFFDAHTVELALDGWFRFHRFKTPQSKKILEREIEKIHSSIIKRIVSEKSSGCFSTTTPSAISNSITTTEIKPKKSAKPMRQQVEGEIELFFPSVISQSERESINAVLVGSGADPVQWQAILDELVGAMVHRQISNPVGYLRGVAERAANGTFIPERGIAVAKERMKVAEVINDDALFEERFFGKLLPLDIVLERLPAATSAFMSNRLGGVSQK